MAYEKWWIKKLMYFSIEMSEYVRICSNNFRGSNFSSPTFEFALHSNIILQNITNRSPKTYSVSGNPIKFYRIIVEKIIAIDINSYDLAHINKIITLDKLMFNINLICIFLYYIEYFYLLLSNHTPPADKFSFR